MKWGGLSVLRATGILPVAKTSGRMPEVLGEWVTFVIWDKIRKISLKEGEENQNGNEKIIQRRVLYEHCP